MSFFELHPIAVAPATLVIASSDSPVCRSPVLGASGRPQDELDKPLPVFLAIQPRSPSAVERINASEDSQEDPFRYLTWQLGEGNATRFLQRTRGDSYTHRRRPSGEIRVSPLRRQSKLNVLTSLAHMELFELGELTLQQRLELVKFAEGTAAFVFQGQKLVNTHPQEEGASPVGNQCEADGCRVVTKRLLTYQEWIELVLFDAAEAGLFSAEKVAEAIIWSYDIHKV